MFEDLDFEIQMKLIIFERKLDPEADPVRVEVVRCWHTKKTNPRLNLLESRMLRPTLSDLKP